MAIILATQSIIVIMVLVSFLASGGYVLVLQEAVDLSAPLLILIVSGRRVPNGIRSRWGQGRYMFSGTGTLSSWEEATNTLKLPNLIIFALII